jgi:hypothetical protein
MHENLTAEKARMMVFASGPESGERREKRMRPVMYITKGVEL